MTGRQLWKLPLIGAVTMVEDLRAVEVDGEARRRMWGPWPLVAALTLGAGTALLGLMGSPTAVVLAPGALALALVVGWRFRGVVRSLRGEGVQEPDRAWVAVVVPVTIAVGAHALVATALRAASAEMVDPFECVEELMTRGAAASILVVILCYARGAFDVFRAVGALVGVWFSVLLLRVVQGLADIPLGILLGVVGLAVPDWLGALKDLGFAALLYGSGISVAWLVARELFPSALDGDAPEVAQTLKALLGSRP